MHLNHTVSDIDMTSEYVTPGQQDKYYYSYCHNATRFLNTIVSYTSQVVLQVVVTQDPR